MFVRIVELRSSIEVQIHMLRISRNMNEALPLLPSESKRIGAAVSLLDDLAKLSSYLEHGLSSRERFFDDTVFSTLHQFTKNQLHFIFRASHVNLS